MPRRRGNGEGSIYKDTRTLKDRSKVVYWRGEIFLGLGKDGRKKVLRVRGRTREDVQREITRLLADRQSGLLIDPSKATVAEYLDRWLRVSVKHSVKVRTFSSYAMNVRLHVEPELGHFLLRKLTAGDVQRMYARKLESGLSPRTVQYLHAILHRALEQAVKWGLLPRNVCDAVDRPKAKRRAMRTFTPEEARRFLVAAEADRFCALYVLALTTGMRQGELFGLRWEDADLDRGTLAVRWQLQWDRETRQFELSETKGGRGRSIALPPMAVRALRLHRVRQAEERLALGEAWDDTWGLVFTTAIGTPVNHGNLLRRSFYPLLDKAGVPRIRLHDLRHTAATLLLAAGEHPRVVQELLGHRSITLTMHTYSHVLPSMQKAAAAKMQTLLEAAH